MTQRTPLTRWNQAVLLTCMLLAASTAAHATSYVPVEDSRLMDRAAVVAMVTVTGIEPGPAQEMPSTDYLVNVQQVIDGDLPGSDVVVRVPGGVRADGVGLKIWGAPELAVDEEVLLFLVPNRDGSFQIVDLMLGAFHVRQDRGTRLALRDLSEAHRIDLNGNHPEEPTRDLDRFVEWLGDRALGIDREADYAVAVPSGPSRLTGEANLTKASDGISPRWFNFDSGKTVRWYYYSEGQPGLTPEQTGESLNRALAAWTNDPASNVDYSFAGPTSVRNGVRTPDNLNTIQFNDPGNVVPGTFDCKQGGVLAMGGPFYYASTRSSRGQSYHEIIEADVITNDGAECYYQNNPVATEEVFGHELGHTLGFAHSDTKEALMWSGVHNDGRGARLEGDDCLAANTVYGDGTYQPPAPPPPPAPTVAPPQLSAAGTKGSVKLSWKHSLGSVKSFAIEMRQSDGSFLQVATVAGSAKKATVKKLAANKLYVFRLRAQLATGEMTSYSNEAQAQVKK